MNLEKVLYRLLLGYYYIYIDNEEYKIIYPSLDIKYRAELLYDKIIEDNKFDKRLLTEKEIAAYLKVNDIWKPSDEEILEKSKKLLDDTKIDLFLNYSNEKNRLELKKRLNSISNDMNRLLNNKNSMNYMGIKDHAVSTKNEFIIMHTIYDKNNELVFNNPNKDTYEYQKLQKFIREILENALDISILRTLAKSELWRSFACAIDTSRDLHTINDDYRYFIGLFRMYDNVRQHPECPSEEIIDDDDALDGWFMYQNKKTEKEKKKNAILNKVRGNTKNAGEVFVITDDVKEAKDIYELNDNKSRNNIKELISLTQKNDNIDMKWADVPFVQRDLRQQMQSMTDRKKGN